MSLKAATKQLDTLILAIIRGGWKSKTDHSTMEILLDLPASELFDLSEAALLGGLTDLSTWLLELAVSFEQYEDENEEIGSDDTPPDGEFPIESIAHRVRRITLAVSK